MTGIVYFRRKAAAGGDGVKLVEAGARVDAADAAAAAAEDRARVGRRARVAREERE